jgi:hypothetical protein
MDMACSTHGRFEKYIENLSENLKGRNQLEELGTDGKTTLKHVLRKYVVMMWMDSSSSVTVTSTEMNIWI